MYDNKVWEESSEQCIRLINNKGLFIKLFNSVVFSSTSLFTLALVCLRLWYFHIVEDL